MLSYRRLVYIVDDDDHVGDATAALLKTVNIKSVTFRSGSDFLQNHDSSAAGCILLDVHMPGLSGLQVLSSLLERGGTIPVVLLV